MRIESPGDVTALSTSGSLTSGISGPNDSTGTAVNAVTVVRTKLTVTAPAASVTGITTTAHPRSANDTIAYFDFTADAANSVVINTVTIKMGGATLASLTLKLIDSDTGATWQSTPTGGIILGLSTTNTAVSGAGTSSVSFSPAYTLSAGATKRIKVQADTTGLTSTTGSTNGSVVQLSIDNDTTGIGATSDGTTTTSVNCKIADGGSNIYCNALGWNDGTSGSINLEAKILPIYAPAISY